MGIRRTLIARKSGKEVTVFAIYIENESEAKKFLLRATNMFDGCNLDWVEVHREAPYVRAPDEPFLFLPSRVARIPIVKG